MPNTAENAIYDRLSSAPVFHPSNADLFAVDWALEPGDVVAVRSGDETYNVPVYAMRFEWKGVNGGESKVNIQSTGNQKRKPLPALKRKQYASGRGAYETKQELKDKEIIYETRFDRTDRYFDLIATESQWDALAQEGHLTAYGELLINSRSINQIVQAIGANGEVTAASIVLSINSGGSSAAINANQIYLNGSTIVSGDGSGLTAPYGWFNNLYAGSGDTFNVEGTDIRAYRRIYAEGGLWALDGADVTASVGNFGSLNVGSPTTQTATWQTDTVVTGINYTTSRRFLYLPEGSYDPADADAVNGRILTGTPTTKTIYYLGHT